jgi:hypothetical protein
MPKQGLLIMKLGSGEVTRIANVKNFQVPSRGGAWLAYLKEAPPAPAANQAKPAAEAKPGEQDEEESEDQQARGQGGADFVQVGRGDGAKVRGPFGGLEAPRSRGKEGETHSGKQGGGQPGANRFHGAAPVTFAKKRRGGQTQFGTRPGGWNAHRAMARRRGAGRPHFAPAPEGPGRGPEGCRSAPPRTGPAPPLRRRPRWPAPRWSGR